MNTKIIEKLIQLRKIEWLEEEHYQAIEYLLVNECKNEDEVSTITDLLYKFVYLDYPQLKVDIETFFKNNIAHYNNDDLPIVFCSLAKDSDTDSSQWLLYIMDRILMDIFEPFDTRIKTINRINNLKRKLKDEKIERYHLIIVDEFLGSGKTLINRLSEFIESQLDSIESHTIYFLAGMKFGKSKVLSKYKWANINMSHELEKGISEKYEGVERITKLKAMCNLEKNLANMAGPCKKETVRLGYGASQALYLRKDGNIPNNVFPIFWWPNDMGGNSRERMGQRPNRKACNQW